MYVCIVRVCWFVVQVCVCVCCFGLLSIYLCVCLSITREETKTTTRKLRLTGDAQLLATLRHCEATLLLCGACRFYSFGVANRRRLVSQVTDAGTMLVCYNAGVCFHFCVT